MERVEGKVQSGRIQITNHNGQNERLLAVAERGALGELAIALFVWFAVRCGEMGVKLFLQFGT
jgi:hypothetical protein